MKKYLFLFVVPFIVFVGCENKSASPPAKFAIDKRMPFYPGANGAIYSLGLYNGRLVAGGNFSQIGNCNSNNIAQFDGSLWSTLNFPGKDSITSFTSWNGNLIAGGFNGSIFEWNGVSWNTLKSDSGKLIIALISYQGNLFAGGYSRSKNVPVLEEWNGSSWVSFGPFQEGWLKQVASMIIYNGNLVIAGCFDSVCGIAANNVAQWNGAAWSPLGNGLTYSNNNVIFSMCIYNSNLIEGSANVNASDTNMLAQWNGSYWKSIPSRFSNEVNYLAVYNGNLFVSGDSYDNQIWNGSTWINTGSGVQTYDSWPTSIQVYNGILYLAGRFNSINGVTAYNIACWNGSNWSAIP